MTKGVKIVFSAADGRGKQTLYYFTTDLSNAGIKKAGFMKFCDKLGRGDSFVKSASYLHAFRRLLRRPRFPSAAQRDAASGRLRHPGQLSEGPDWDLSPHGKYLGPDPAVLRQLSEATR